MLPPLSEQGAIDYVRGVEALAAIVGDGPLQSAAITEGNINLIFRVSSVDAPIERSVLIKQALSHSWRYPDFQLPVERQRIEYELLSLEARYCPEQTPAVYFYDPENHILAVEDLNRHVMMREGLMRQERYPLVAQHIGSFMARTLFYTSDLYLSSADKKALLPRYINPVMRKLQEDLVFTQPYMDHPNNRWSKPLDQQVAMIHADDELRAAIFALKEAYMTHAQALLHNDLHTGSILLNQQQSKVIDPEFAFFGPIGHDIGSYLANLVIGYAAQEFHAPGAAERAAYRQWLLARSARSGRSSRPPLRSCGRRRVIEEWPSPSFRARYIRRLLQDSAGFGAAEIFRRTIGLAHVQDFWTITDEQTRRRREPGARCGLQLTDGERDIHNDRRPGRDRGAGAGGLAV